MSTLAEIEAAADSLPPEQKQELLQFLSTRLQTSKDSAPGIEKRESAHPGTGFNGINKTSGVSGGAACIRDTRIAVWTLVQLKKLGRSELQLLDDFPSLLQADLDTVWNYYRAYPVEIDEAIAAQDRED